MFLWSDWAELGGSFEDMSKETKVAWRERLSDDEARGILAWSEGRLSQ